MRIYGYIAPINECHKVASALQYSCSNKIQIATFLASDSTDKTVVDLEMAVSNNDNNLFSSIDDANNTGISTKISAKQRIFSKRWKLMLLPIINSHRNFPA
jgi:hypothetical protein